MADLYLKALYQDFVGVSGTASGHTYDTFPDNDDIAITAGDTVDIFGAYVAVVTTNGAADTWTYGVHLSALSAATDEKMALATGAASSETDRLTVPFVRTDGTTAGQTYGVNYTIPFPIRVPTGTRIAARSKAGSASATTNIVELHGLALV